MADVGMPLLVHSEVTDADVDVFDREAKFVETILAVRHHSCRTNHSSAIDMRTDCLSLLLPFPPTKPLVRSNPSLKVVMEHITTAEGVEFVSSCGENVAATITPQHLMYNRNGKHALQKSPIHKHQSDDDSPGGASLMIVFVMLDAYIHSYLPRGP